MTVEFLAMAIIMALLIVFAVLLLHSLTSSANVRIRADMLTLLSAYDKLIDKKSKEVRRLDRELEKHRAETAAPAEAAAVQAQSQTPEVPAFGARSRLDPPDYRLREMKSSYETIRDNFRVYTAQQDALYDAVCQRESKRPLRGSDAAKLAQALSFDTVYTLSLMAPDEQLSLLRASLEERDAALLEDYLAESGETAFSASRFWAWLKSLAQLEDDSVTVCCGDEDACRDGSMAYSRGIFEGIQIRTGSHLYDYSIGESEIG